MAKIVGLLRRQDLPQLLFHLKGILGPVGQTQAAGNPDAVGIADIGGLAVDVTQNQVGRLPPHAGEAGQLLDRKSVV